MSSLSSMPTAPPRPPVRKGFCGAGHGPCGARPARFFKDGWRCDACKPADPVRVVRPPLVIAIRLVVAALLGLLG